MATFNGSTGARPDGAQGEPATASNVVHETKAGSLPRIARETAAARAHLNGHESDRDDTIREAARRIEAGVTGLTSQELARCCDLVQQLRFLASDPKLNPFHAALMNVAAERLELAKAACASAIPHMKYLCSVDVGDDSTYGDRQALKALERFVASTTGAAAGGNSSTGVNAARPSNAPAAPRSFASDFVDGARKLAPDIVAAVEREEQPWTCQVFFRGGRLAGGVAVLRFPAAFKVGDPFRIAGGGVYVLIPGPAAQTAQNTREHHDNLVANAKWAGDERSAVMAEVVSQDVATENRTGRKAVRP